MTNGGFRSDVVDVLLQQDAAIAEAVARNDERERYVEGWLVPTIARRRAELDRLTQKLDALHRAQQRHRDDTERMVQLQAELRSARAESDALRRSMSWRLTAPLRSVVAWLLLRGRP